jgi:hypothetical protein
MLTTPTTELFQFQLFLGNLFGFVREIIDSFALGALKFNGRFFGGHSLNLNLTV